MQTSRQPSTPRKQQNPNHYPRRQAEPTGLPQSPTPLARRKWEAKRQMRRDERQPERDEVQLAERNIQQCDHETDECQYGEHQDLLQLDEHLGWHDAGQPSA